MTVDDITDEYIDQNFDSSLTQLKQMLGQYGDDEDDWVQRKSYAFDFVVREVEKKANVDWDDIENQDDYKASVALNILWQACESIGRGIYDVKAKKYRADYYAEFNKQKPEINSVSYKSNVGYIIPIF
ncbi:MAG TPA: hypothetical protein PL019_08910 [Caldisericia bacterium]|nr:hypothetical protein [Caldisericia bacterium]